MATDRTFNAMLNENLHYDLLRNEFVERQWLMSKCVQNEKWKGGTIPIPFEGASASSVEFGSLPVSTDIADSLYVRGTLSTAKEMWGTLKFRHRDIIEHNGRVNEDSFLSLLPGEIERFMKRVKNKSSITALHGYADVATANGDASGNITVAHPERFSVNEKVYVDDDDSAAVVGYIRTINMNSGVLTLYDARSGGSVVNLSTYTTAQNAKIYFSGSQPTTSAGWTSVRQQLLSAANGGDSTIFGVTKTLYPYTQALNISGSTFTEDNILEGLFNKFVTFRNRCDGVGQSYLMSYQNWAAALKNVQSIHGPFSVDPASRKSSEYGWDEIAIGGPKGNIKLVAVQEMSDSEIYYIDPKSFTFHSNGGFQKLVTPDGNMYQLSRDATNGISYLVDLYLYGDLVCQNPLANGVIHSVNFSLSES